MYRKQFGYGALASILGKRPRVGNRYAPAGGQPREAGETVLYAPVNAWEPPKDKRRQKDMGYSGDFTRTKLRGGRHARRGSGPYTRKVVKDSIQRLVYGFDDTTSFGGTSGALQLRNDAATPAAAYTVPCHLWDLTCAPNQAGGTAYSAQCGFQPVFTDTTGATGRLYWTTLGNAVASVNVPSSGTSSLVGQRAMLRSVKAKFLFYCPTTLPTRVVMNLVQFRDQRLNPVVSSATKVNLNDYQSAGYLLPSGVAVTQGDMATGVYRDLVHSVAKNPVCQTSNHCMKDIKVLWSHQFILNPKESTEPVATRYHEVDLFREFNRSQNFSWDDDSVYDIQTNDQTGYDIAENKCTVHPRARIYLMIRAISGYGTAFSATVNPSYDMSLRLHYDDMGA